LSGGHGTSGIEEEMRSNSCDSVIVGEMDLPQGWDEWSDGYRRQVQWIGRQIAENCGSGILGIGIAGELVELGQKAAMAETLDAKAEARAVRSSRRLPGSREREESRMANGPKGATAGA